MFPTANSQVYYNDAGEPLGWDYPSNDYPDNEPADRDDYTPGEYDEPRIHTTAAYLVVHQLLDEQIPYTTGDSVEVAQSDGVGDWEEGNAHGYNADSEYTPFERLAYTHGQRTGHRRCTCSVAGPDGQPYTMNELPD